MPARRRVTARLTETYSSRLRRWLSALASVALAGCGTSDIESGAGPTDAPTIQVEKYTLDNGLEVLLVEDHRLPLVAVNLWYHVGPVNEEPGRTGFAHLFEHMMFQGSAHLPDGTFDRLLTAAGATGINGSTDFDRTNYYETVPADQLELALWLESDRMGFLLEEVDQVRLSNQQDVVRNERRQGVDNAPYGLVDEAVYHSLFPADHPYYGSVIGSHADIQAASLEDVREFFVLYYAPNNATLALVGDFDPLATRVLIERYFGTLRGGPPVPGPNVVTPPLTSERRVTVEDRVDLPRVYMAWLTPSAFEPGDAEARILSDILADGESSRLYRALVYELQVAQEVWTSYDPLELGSIFQVRATASAGRTAEELEAAIDDVLEGLLTAPPEAAEVERARNTLETRMVQGFESLGGLADQLNRYNHYLGDPNYLNDDLARYAAVSPASIQSFVLEHLSPEARVVVHGVPGEPARPPDVPVSTPPAAVAELDEFLNPDEPWRAETPARGTPRELEVPIPETFELPNGLTVMVNERPELPVVSASLVVRRGAGDNPGDRPGLASLTTDVLTQGTASRSALEVSEAVAQLGASLNAVTTIDAMRINASSLARSFPALLEILADVTLNPSFPVEEVERRRGTRLGALTQEGNTPMTIAERAVFRSLFGDVHPYGYRDSGAPVGVRSATREEILGFWSEHFVPSNAALVVSGQVTVDELRPMVEEAFGDWPAAEESRAITAEPRTTDARLVLVDRPGAPQTELRVVTVGVPRSTPDFEAVALMNTILGGLGVSTAAATNFSSRIMLNLREEHGYTYGAVSQFVFRRSRGPFWSGGTIRTDATAPAVTEILNEIRRIRDEPVTEEELALAKDSQIRSIAAQYQTSAGVTATTAGIHIYDLGVDYYRGIAARLSEVTIEDVQAAAQRHLDPDQMIVVAVGDLATIRAPLEALALGRVEIRDVEGNVIP